MQHHRHLNLRKVLLAVLALTVGTFAWFVHSRRTHSQELSRKNKEALAPLLLRSQAEPPAPPQYTLLDGAVVDGQAAGAVAQADAAPGKVEVLDIRKAYDRANRLAAQTQGRVFKSSITPHWFGDNTLFWYRNDFKGGAKEFILVDAVKGARRPAFDHARLAAGLTKRSGTSYEATRLPFDRIDFTEDTKTVRFDVAGRTWSCDLGTYTCERIAKQTSAPLGIGVMAVGSRWAGIGALALLTDAPESVNGMAESPASDEDPSELEPPAFPDDDDFQEQSPQFQKKGKKGFGPPGAKFGPPATREARAPDGNWTAVTKDNNIFLRDKQDKETQVTTNGVAGNAYSGVAWSPDGKTIVAYRTEPGDKKEVYMIETSPRDQLPAKLHTRAYPRPGDRLSTHEMWLIPLALAGEGKAATVDVKPIQVDVERIDEFRGIPRLRWSKDRRRFTFEKADRGHQRFRVIEVEVATGKTRNIIDERADTFLWTMHPPRDGQMTGVFVQYLDDTEEILYGSQRDGWKHLYLIDATTGKIKHQITSGAWVVRAVDRVDVKERQIWFRGSGKHADQDPYLMHHYRVNFDGTEAVALTEGNGNHTIQYSPDRKHVIDTYSRVDLPPVHELRRVADGTLVCKLDEANVSALHDHGLAAPEVFVAKGRDNVTDIWGIVCRPQNYDETKKYPVIEMIYAGPHDSHVPKTFAAYRSLQALAELGFIVVQCEGMGTAHRSRAFHDVCWKNLADAGFPDRILWIKALAKRYAYVDATRVGIYGTSAGGQSAAGAVLFHPEFYKVAVASCGCHDNRLDKITWNEQWMGLMGPHYEKQSNVTQAGKLEGKLLLIVGELDTNVPFESTMRVADALIRAGKDFELIFTPGMGHSGGGTYGDRRRWDFFVRHLHGIEPPNRNGR